MLIRYAKNAEGKPVRRALVYTKEEHRIDRRSIDREALHIVDRLAEDGHETYIVGGAVRDLLVGKRPKDFDIVTEATPAKIKRLFRNSRVIGRRFRLVHVFFGPKIYEVSTFRSLADGTTSNTYGSIEEDVLRRDFTMNALFYDPRTETVVDYVGGVQDIRRKRVRAVIPLNNIFLDDPVRMIRAAKYAATTGFSLPLRIKWKIRSQASLLEPISPSRLTEEINKVLHSGRASAIVPRLVELRLFAYLQPNAARLLAEKPEYRDAFARSLSAMDELVSGDPDTRTGALLACWLRDYLDGFVDWRADPAETYRSALAACRSFVLPMNPPRIELENGVRICFRERGVTVKKARTFEKGERSERVPRGGEARTDGGELPQDGQAKKKRRRRHRRRKPASAQAPSKGDGGGESAGPAEA